MAKPILQADSIDGIKTEKNYIGGQVDKNTQGWATYADAADVIPVDGTGGSPNVTWTLTTTTPLRGVSSFLLTKDGSANRQGQGVSYDFTIDRADRFNVQRISFEYEIASGTFDYGDGTVATPSELRVFIYDITNGVLIEPTQTLLDGSGKYFSEFQASDSTSYRLILHIARTLTNNWTFEADNFSVGPRELALARGPIMTDWATFTPSDTSYTWGSLTSTSWRWRRIGQDIEVQFHGQMGGAVTSGIFFSPQEYLPPGLTTDLTSINATMPMGAWYVDDVSAASSADNAGGVIMVQSGNGQIVFLMGTTAADILSATQPMTWAANDIFSFSVKVPILGWGSNTVTSSDSGTRVVALTARRASSNQTVSSTSATDVIYNSIIKDTHGMLNTSTGIVTVPESGFYSIKANAEYGSYTANETSNLIIQVNGTTIAASDKQINATSFFHGVGADYYLNANDQIKIQVQSPTDTSYTINNSVRTNLSIFKIQSPQSIGMADRVGCKYTSATTTVGTSTGTVVYPTKVYDYTNSYNTSTGAFTCPIAGIYHVIGTMSGTTQSSALNTSVGLRIAKGGVEQYSSLFTFQVTSTNLAIRQQVSVMVYANAGETLSIQCNRSASISSFSLNGSDTDCTMMITRIA
jgi:hypothetical protein